MSQNDVVSGQSREHLTAKEISRWLVEGPDQAASQHLQSCLACQAKLAEAEAPLVAFRAAVVGWSESLNASRLPGSIGPEFGQQRSLGLRWWVPLGSLAFAILLAVGFLKGPELFRGHPDGQPATLTSNTSAASDAALMDQVDIEVSEAVPDAMAPLTDLVAWDSNEGAAAGAMIPEKNSSSKISTKAASAKAHADLKD